MTIKLMLTVHSIIEFRQSSSQPLKQAEQSNLAVTISVFLVGVHHTSALFILSSLRCQQICTSALFPPYHHLHHHKTISLRLPMNLYLSSQQNLADKILSRQLATRNADSPVRKSLLICCTNHISWSFI